MKLSSVGAFPLLISLCNMHKGRVHDVTHCYNLGKLSVLLAIVQSNCGLTSKSLQHNFFQRPLIVGRLLNNMLKIRQNLFGET